ncbi:hypothetical protein JHK84_044899 [Glycine max]|nr:hypothetical protein JHK86_044788 [Glycine max]KAG4951538.1 hypothetical protein JHK85_045405 [Glycine max]KAG5107992.1 hypothetical protein JHK84_044899 [Glycine max]
MASNHLLTLTRRLRRRLPSLRLFSTFPAATKSPSPPAPTPPDAMLYDRLAEATKAKLRRLDNPDPRFLKHGSPVPALADHTRVLGAPETRVTTLPNGLRVATESSLASQTATVGVWIDAGSRFETEETNGTAHFLEHMIFKGTAKRTVRELEEEIENMGGHLNAYTSREQTTYYAKVTEKDVPKALDILADILQNSKFDEKRISRERDVILREMEEVFFPGRLGVEVFSCLIDGGNGGANGTMEFEIEKKMLSISCGYVVEGQMEEVIFDHLHATAFQYTPLGRTILGPAQNIMTITKDHLQNYIQTHYTAPRMVVAASGAVKHEEIVEQVRILDDDIPLAQFAVAFEGAAWTDPDSVALMVMQAMLGSWNKTAGGGKHMGSELAQRVGINEVAESMMAFNTNYKDTGLFGVYAVANKDCLDDLSYAIMYETTKLAYRVSEDDVTRACNQINNPISKCVNLTTLPGKLIALKSSLLLHIDGTSPVAEDIGRQLLTYGRRIPFAELFARIDAVDASTIKRVANRFIYDKDIAIAAMGPIQRLPDYNWFRRRTYWNRY